jgi:hypothetical protein
MRQGVLVFRRLLDDPPTSGLPASQPARFPFWWPVLGALRAGCNDRLRSPPVPTGVWASIADRVGFVRRGGRNGPDDTVSSGLPEITRDGSGGKRAHAMLVAAAPGVKLQTVSTPNRNSRTSGRPWTLAVAPSHQGGERGRLRRGYGYVSHRVLGRVQLDRSHLFGMAVMPDAEGLVVNLALLLVPLHLVLHAHPLEGGNVPYSLELLPFHLLWFWFVCSGNDLCPHARELDWTTKRKIRVVHPWSGDIGSCHEHGPEVVEPGPQSPRHRRGTGPRPVRQRTTSPRSSSLLRTRR